MRPDITVPNLPDSNVGLVLVKNEKRTVSALEALGIRTLSPEKNAVLADEVSEHADMLCFYAGDGVCVLSPDQTELKKELEDRGFSVRLSSPLQGSYPGDIILNFAVTEKLAVGNFRHADDTLLGCINNKNKINVKQGYAKCSTCIVRENAFITEDSGIAAALRKNGADVLPISSGDVFLSDIHSGFFGGATGKLSNTKLAVNGSLHYHRDGEKILAFLRKHGIEAVELFDGVITDIGGMIPLREI